MRGCEPGGTMGCCQQIYSVQSDTDGEVWERGHAGSLASCGERLLGSWGCWMMGSCSGRMFLRKRMGGNVFDYNSLNS